MFTRNSLLAAGLTAGLAFAGSAGAAPIIFDPDGANANGGANKGNILVNSLDWDAGNALLVGGIIPALQGTGIPYNATLVLQSRLSAFQPGSAAPSADADHNGFDDLDGGSVYEFTYQATIPVLVTSSIIGGGVNVLQASLAGAGQFDVFFDAVADGNASVNNTGCGYGTAFLAPCGADGSVSILSGTFSAAALNLNITPDATPAALDGFNNNGLPAVTTWSIIGGGSASIDVAFADAAFFKTDITLLTTDIDFQGSAGGAPFAQTNPTQQVVGVKPNYGLGNVNGEVGCGGAGACDVHTQNDATMSFLHDQPVPEPGTLALLGVGLGLLGWRRARRAA